jgi:hypothetical protein
MSTTLEMGVAAWRSSDWHAARARRRAILTGATALALAVVYAWVVVVTNGTSVVLVPLLGALITLAIFAEPSVGVYILFGIALLFEEFAITGLAPITAQTRLYENIASYTPIPLRLSARDLIALLTIGCWVLRRIAHGEKPRMGPLGWPVAAYGGAFVFGLVIGAARGGSFDLVAGLSELHGPLTLCLMYFLAVNLIRTSQQVTILMWEFVVLVGIKAFQGILNYQDATSGFVDIYSVTAHEDVVFFGLAMALVVMMVVLRVRTRFALALLAIQPLVLAAELIAARRAGFVGLGAVWIVIVLLSVAGNGRRGLVLAGLSGFVALAYVFAFWDAEGIVGGPIRALRSVVDTAAVPFRDQASNLWRDIENQNIAYTMSQLPLTGVGAGQKYLFQRQPTPLLGFPYWEYETHNAVLWLWLKAGPVGAFALWFLVSRTLILGSALYVRLRDPALRWVAVLPVAVIVLQIVFSSVELGLTYSRTMIVDGTILGLTAFLVEQHRREAATSRPQVRTA